MTSASPRNKRLGLLGASLAVAALGLTACGGSSGGAKKAAGSPSPSPSATMAPGAMFSVANVPGLGDVVVDARGRTVVQDNGPGQANGQGIRSFGGTWYALTAAGDPVMSASSPSPSSGG